MTLKRLTLAAVATVALSSTALAAEGGHWALGTAVYMNQLSPAAFVATYINNQFLAQVGLGYYNSKPAGSSSTSAFSTDLRFGLRNMMSNNVSVDYGVAGNYAFTNYPAGSTSKDPYTIGAFVGVDYMVTNNVLLTAAVQPYSYERNASNTKESNLFNAGSLSVSYVFS